MSTNDSKLQYETIKRIIQSSPSAVKRPPNSKLSYSIVKRIIETSPLEKKHPHIEKGFQPCMSGKALYTLRDFFNRQTAMGQTGSRNDTHDTEALNEVNIDENMTESVDSKLTHPVRASKPGKAQIFVGGKPLGTKLQTNGNISPVARGKSWITVKVD